MSRANLSAVFTDRLRSLDPSLIELAEKMKELGWTTLGSFAFCVDGPNMPNHAENFEKQVMLKLFPNETVAGVAPPDVDGVPGVAPPDIVTLDPRRSSVRRLFFEAYSIVVAETERLVNAPDDVERPRQLPLPERVHRKQLFIITNPKVEVEDETEVSDGTVDKYVTMCESGILRYLPWDQHISRCFEIKNIKKHPFFELDPKNGLVWKEGSHALSCSVSSEMQLIQLMQRRGMGLEMGRLLHYQVHLPLAKWYIREFTMEIPHDSIHDRITL